MGKPTSKWAPVWSAYLRQEGAQAVKWGPKRFLFSFSMVSL
jgi:hypothetical protein